MMIWSMKYVLTVEEYVLALILALVVSITQRVREPAVTRDGPTPTPPKPPTCLRPSGWIRRGYHGLGV